MKLRAIKRRHAASDPGSPWVKIATFVSEQRAKVNRAKCRGTPAPLIPLEIGAIDFFRVIISPSIEFSEQALQGREATC